MLGVSVGMPIMSSGGDWLRVVRELYDEREGGPPLGGLLPLGTRWPNCGLNSSTSSWVMFWATSRT